MHGVLAHLIMLSNAHVGKEAKSIFRPKVYKKIIIKVNSWFTHCKHTLFKKIAMNQIDETIFI